MGPIKKIGMKNILERACCLSNNSCVEKFSHRPSFRRELFGLEIFHESRQQAITSPSDLIYF